MKLILCILIGYLLGSISPAALFGKLKNVNLKETGSKNLGASNAWITLGKSYFFAIMVLDIFKSWLAAQIAWKLLPDMPAAGYIASLAAILGHIFPFYLNFKGGKGLAAFGGFVCAYNFWLLVFYLLFGFGLTLVFNHSWVMPFMIALTFPIVLLVGGNHWSVVLVGVIASVVILIMHFGNFKKAMKGTDFTMRKVVGDRMKNKEE